MKNRPPKNARDFVAGRASSRLSPLSLNLQTWHNGGMGEKRAPQKTALRYSFPPYYVGTVEAGLPIMSLPGELYEGLERSYAPTAAEATGMLLALRERLRWSRPMLAAFLGVSRDVVRRWETGERNPSGAARRLIWLLVMLVCNRAKLQDAMDLLVWCKGESLGL
jgi:hypothetical protein